MKDEKVYKGKRYSYGELSDKFEEVLFVWDSGADYVLFGDGKRFGLFRNSGFEQMGRSPKYAYAIGEYLGYTEAYLFNMHAGARPEEYQYAYQCYLALGNKEKWIIYAFDLHSAYDVNNDDELPGVSVMAESLEGIGNAIEKLSRVIGIHIDRWFDLSTKDFTTLWDPHPRSNDEIYYTPEYAEPSPESIKELKDNQIFVFGSNLAGRHGAGAAKYAFDNFGAVWGQGVGLQGRSYAIPTMQGPVESIKPYVDDFLDFARDHPELEFLVTRIGCGIAGFSDEQIAPLFWNACHYNNVRLPESFIRILRV